LAIFSTKKVVCRFQTYLLFSLLPSGKVSPKEKKAQEQVCLHVWISSYAHEIAFIA
jgi:hypothetical protein